MPNNLDQAHANDLLKASLGMAVLPATALPVKMRLMTNATTPSSTTNGTEVTNAGGSNYQPQDVVPSGTGNQNNILAAPTTGSTTSTAAVNFQNMPGATTVAAIELWDATPKRKWFAPITSKTTNLGDTLSFGPSNLSVALA
jgi:hypothetical protein